VSHPSVHAKNSVKKFGGKPENYIEIHHWFDESKQYLADMRHRALRHHAQGIFECEQIFGKSFVNSDGKEVYTRYVGEQHVIEDLGFIPTIQDWFECMDMQKWMMARDRRIKNKMEFGDRLPLSLSRIDVKKGGEE
jgi:hypothetical protein